MPVPPPVHHHVIPAGVVVVGEVEEYEVNSDFQFMLRTLPVVATEICEKRPWIAAGRHGTIEAREEYTRQLRANYSIIVIQQSVHSPEVNALDLGI